MTYDEVIEFLRRCQRETFDAGIFHQDEFGTYSASEKEASEFEDAAESLVDLRAQFFGEYEP